MTLYVPPDGPLTARIACIGQNPGKTEVNPHVMKPFSGYSGNLLNKWWAQLGTHRTEIYIEIRLICAILKGWIRMNWTIGGMNFTNASLSSLI